MGSPFLHMGLPPMSDLESNSSHLDHIFPPDDVVTGALDQVERAVCGGEFAAASTGLVIVAGLAMALNNLPAAGKAYRLKYLLEAWPDRKADIDYLLAELRLDLGSRVKPVPFPGS
ncbi:hypothetical protein HBF26_13895 [Luteibacter jiangsuensis]|uniref:Uncharacterized protein n=1 Tax=Luteibacter jiangsuensis TaxID=637577 RepID=A0ABX0Q8M6_9GAMM|nr:hypothetical protein [Luteibacter jiangsuensis]NID05987.1 hypothetical protein [Luteibacter jiangsuensis]